MTDTGLRICVDTNVIVSAALSPGSTASKAFNQVVYQNTLLYSDETLAEARRVLARPKFLLRTKPFIKTPLNTIVDLGELITPTIRVTDCRDPKDNIFLELALSGRADLILTGDADLLTLHPWRTISILTPANYLAL